MATLDTTPLTDTFGVIIHNLDLADVTEDHLYPELREAFENHSALLLKGQNLTHELHIKLARLFGPVENRKNKNSDDLSEGDDFEVPEVSNVKKDGSVTGEDDIHTLNLRANMLWHADSTFLPIPSLVNILTAKVVTTEGGHTDLASTRAAFSDMSPEKQDELRNHKFWHKYSHSRAQIDPELAKKEMFNLWDDQIWPAVWKNPKNGKEAVYVASHSFAVEGMDAEAGQAYITDLIETCTQPKYAYSHKWEVGDVLIWDQRAVVHRGTPWPIEQPRTLQSICSSVTEADGLAEMRAA